MGNEISLAKYIMSPYLAKAELLLRVVYIYTCIFSIKYMGMFDEFAHEVDLFGCVLLNLSMHSEQISGNRVS